MKRDGANTSLWQNKMPDYVPRSATFVNKDFDVIIVGGGITGVTTALLLQKAGKQCLIVESYNLCFGTTGGTTAHLNSFLDTSYDKIENDFGEDAAQLVASATTKSLELFRANIEQYKIDCGYSQQDGFVYAQDEKQLKELQKMFLASQKAGADVSYTDRIPVPGDFLEAIIYHEQAQIHPAKYVYALANEFEKLGGIIVQNCRVDKVVEGEGIFAVDTTLGPVKTAYLIWATHIPPNINFLHFTCAPYRSYAMAVRLKNNDYPNGLCYDMCDPYYYYRTQEVDGEKYLIAGGEDHKTGHEENTEACFTKLEAHVHKLYEVDKVAFKWSSQYFEPADGLAYIGLLPGSSGNILVATGYGGNGITYSHIAAPLLTDLIMEKENAFAALFNPHRIKPVAGFTNFVKEATDVVAEFVSGHFSSEKMNALVDLAPGEAKIIKYEGTKLAIYKDENGVAHALNPVCTHAKCIVDWNSTEKTWDCPCHGARYNIDGEVLTGPAKKDLQKISLNELIEK